MSTLIDPQSPSRRPRIEPGEASVRSQVWRVLSAMYPQVQRPERRSEERYPYPRLVYLAPVAEDGISPLGESLIVAGKHLSEHGLGFFHPAPLTHRRVIATLERVDDEWLSFLLDVRWCRFSRLGWYESGGRFLRLLPNWRRPE